MNAKKADTGFEASLERLESIVNEMEDGSLSLDELLAHFEEGSRLVKQCSTKLTEVEQKIEKLVSLDDPEGVAPFDPEV
jgi:exodeoxyribonuclease VII small subunit